MADDKMKELTDIIDRHNLILAGIRQRHEQVLELLDTVNSRFPTTKAFLEARGLTRVSQLDKAGMAELKAHLQLTLRKVTN